MTKELSEVRMKQRQERFGIETKESMDVKKQERMKRFGAMEEQSASGVTSEEMESKRKARMERFGAAEGKESQEASFKMNRRRVKMMSKGGEGKSIVVEGNGKGGNKQR